MVTGEITDGTRIGRLFASEVHGHERGALGRFGVVEATPDVEATEAGAFAFAIATDDGGKSGSVDAEHANSRVEAASGGRLAEAYVHPDRLRLEFLAGVEAAAEAGRSAGLRTRPKAVEPPRTLVFVERGADAKAALRVARRVAESLLEDGG